MRLVSPISSPVLPTNNLPTKAMLQPIKIICIVLATIGIYLLTRRTGSVEFIAGSNVARSRNGTCEEQGMYSRRQGDSDPARIVNRISLKVSPVSSKAEQNQIHETNTLSSIPFHPTLSSQFSTLFPGTPSSASPYAVDKSKSECIAPVAHFIPMLDPPPLRPGETNLFFAFTTTPERATQFSSIWSHFLSTPSPKFNSQKLWYSDDQPPKPPGCLVIDARGRDDPRMATANVALKKAGTGCVMKNGSRNKERYEMRVLGLIKDAFEESELRRFQDGPGAAKVEWFVFG